MSKTLESSPFLMEPGGILSPFTHSEKIRLLWTSETKRLVQTLGFLLFFCSVHVPFENFCVKADKLVAPADTQRTGCFVPYFPTDCVHDTLNSHISAAKVGHGGDDPESACCACFFL